VIFLSNDHGFPTAFSENKNQRLRESPILPASQPNQERSNKFLRRIVCSRFASCIRVSESVDFCQLSYAICLFKWMTYHFHCTIACPTVEFHFVWDFQFLISAVEQWKAPYLARRRGGRINDLRYRRAEEKNEIRLFELRRAWFIILTTATIEHGMSNNI